MNDSDTYYQMAYELGCHAKRNGKPAKPLDDMPMVEILDLAKDHSELDSKQLWTMKKNWMFGWLDTMLDTMSSIHNKVMDKNLEKNLTLHRNVIL